MEYRRLGKTGVKVSPICLGTGIRGKLDEDLYIRCVHRAIDLGINFLDCANNYAGGESERVLGKAIKGKRDDLVITSKVWTPTGKGPNDRGLSRFHILREVERTLAKLDTDHVDIYYLHNVDPDTELEETLQTMEDLVRQGKVRYVGASNYSAAGIAELLWTADRMGLEPIVCIQNQYNLLHRWKMEPEVLGMCNRYGLGLMTYSPLAIGLLSGRFHHGEDPPEGTPWNRQRLDRMLTERGEKVVQALVEMAGEKGATPGQLAFAWVLDHPEVTAPIAGADRIEYVEEAVGSLEIELSLEERQRLDEVSQWERPGDYL